MMDEKIIKNALWRDGYHAAAKWIESLQDELDRVKSENIQLKEFIAKYEPKEHWETLNEYCDNLKNELDRVKRERDAAYKKLGGEPPKTCKTCILWGTNGWGQYKVGYCEGDDHPHGEDDFCSRHRN